MDGIPLSSKKCPGLRLVFPDAGPSLAQAQARRAVEAENRHAATLASGGLDRAEDVRQIFALRAAQALDGGRAAILPADRRRMLVDSARKMGMRPFEANLIIAIVQDCARRGEGPASAETTRVVRMIPVAPVPWWRRDGLASVVAALVLGALLLVILIDWVTRG